MDGGLDGQGCFARPERLRAVVGREDDDRVVRDAQVIEGVKSSGVLNGIEYFDVTGWHGAGAFSGALKGSGYRRLVYSGRSLGVGAPSAEALVLAIKKVGCNTLKDPDS